MNLTNKTIFNMVFSILLSVGYATSLSRRQSTSEERLLHPCYDVRSPINPFDDDDDDISLSHSEILASLRIELHEAERNAGRYISNAVTEACLNVHFRRFVNRYRLPRVQPRIQSCRDFRLITRHPWGIFDNFVNINGTINGSYYDNFQNNMILAVLLVQHELDNEDSEVFRSYLSRLQYKLYDIVCLLQYNNTITDDDVTVNRNIRDRYINGLFRNAHNYERSLVVVSAIKTFLQTTRRNLSSL